MGRGDKKSKRGKIALGSYGNSRRRKAVKTQINKVSAKKEEAVSEIKVEPVKPKRSPRKKTEA